MTQYREWFKGVTKETPFDYQNRLATSDSLPSFIQVETGCGKTAAVVLAWLWRRHVTPDLKLRQRTPRRLIYCLPMRTLVEQTYAEIQNWLNQARLDKTVQVHMLMGGAIAKDWQRDLTGSHVLVGTQDQLLSRALNRGYSMSRYLWPIHFALLNNDCLWVMDETQLMGAGLKTTAQLDGFRQQLGTYGPTHSIWMSATLDREQLQTVDSRFDPEAIHALTEKDRGSPLVKRLEAAKPLQQAETQWLGKLADYAKALAKEIASAHKPGELTLVICNQVDRVQAIYGALAKLKGLDLDELLLVHSRFRPAERQKLNEHLRKKELSGIVIATQTVEAGVDISASKLFTELAPWSSLVQRFGRCNRRGEQSDAQVYWIDTPELSKKGIALPYEASALEEARQLLQKLTDVGPNSLKTVTAAPVEVDGLIPRQNDLLQLFDTSTDLAGHDIDVSPFIRDAEDTDVQLAWRNWQTDTDKTDADPTDIAPTDDTGASAKKKPPKIASALRPEELCRVNRWKAEAFLKKLDSKAKPYWCWDSNIGNWVQPQSIYPGLSLLLPCNVGGYGKELGFTGNPKDKPHPIGGEPIEQDEDNADRLSQLGPSGQFITLKQHAEDVAKQVAKRCQALEAYGLPDASLLERAGRWHDLGKAHDVFQEMLRGKDPAKKQPLWAKSDGCKGGIKQGRRGFRHELVSALVALQQQEPFLLCYLVAAHHGKVRMAIQPRPGEVAPEDGRRYALGVWDQDLVPEVDLGDGLQTVAQSVSLEVMQLGLSSQGASWSERALELLDHYGPFKLAWLESLIRLSDWEASSQYVKAEERDDFTRRNSNL